MRQNCTLLFFLCFSFLIYAEPEPAPPRDPDTPAPAAPAIPVPISQTAIPTNVRTDSFRSNGVSSANTYDGNDPLSLGVASVSRNGDTTHYIITDRRLLNSGHEYSGLFDPRELRGKRVLDIGTGGGSFVTALRNFENDQCRAVLDAIRNEGEELQRHADTARGEEQAHQETGRALLVIPSASGTNAIASAVHHAAAEVANRQASRHEADANAVYRRYGESQARCNEIAARNTQPYVDAHGIDIALPQNLRNLPNIFRQGDAADTRYPASHFDHLFSSWSVFSYEGRNGDLMRRILTESSRILRTNGKLTIQPFFQEDLPILQRALAQVPGLEITRGVTPPIYQGGTQQRMPRPGSNGETGTPLIYQTRGGTHATTSISLTF